MQFQATSAVAGCRAQFLGVAQSARVFGTPHRRAGRHKEPHLVIGNPNDWSLTVDRRFFCHSRVLSMFKLAGPSRPGLVGRRGVPKISPVTNAGRPSL